MNNAKRLLFLAVGLYCIPSMIYADVQKTEGLTLIAQLNPIPPVGSQEKPPFAREETMEIKLLGTGMIRFYQRYVATQDLPVCNFQPSCSAFGMQAIQRYGFPRGVLLTADRLMRDNPTDLGRHYQHDRATDRYCDPIERYAPEMLK